MDIPQVQGEGLCMRGGCFPFTPKGGKAGLLIHETRPLSRQREKSSDTKGHLPITTPIGAIGALMNRALQPRPLVVLGLNVWMGTAAGADELVGLEVPNRSNRFNVTQHTRPQPGKGVSSGRRDVHVGLPPIVL